jgi:hypothetical protein
MLTYVAWAQNGMSLDLAIYINVTISAMGTVHPSMGGHLENGALAQYLAALVASKLEVCTASELPLLDRCCQPSSPQKSQAG